MNAPGEHSVDRSSAVNLISEFRCVSEEEASHILHVIVVD